MSLPESNASGSFDEIPGTITQTRPTEYLRYPREINDPYVPPVRQSPYGSLADSYGYPPINVHTQGCDTYQKMGFIYDPETPDYRLPLFGRKKYYNGDKYEYYVQDASIHKNKIELDKKNDNELFTDDEVNVSGYPNKFMTHIYEVDQPRYCPNI